MPAKLYLALFLLMGNDEDSRIRINNWARSLVVKAFLDELGGGDFLTEAEAAELRREYITEMGPQSKQDAESWGRLIEQFRRRPKYTVKSVEELPTPSIIG